MLLLGFYKSFAPTLVKPGQPVCHYLLSIQQSEVSLRYQHLEDHNKNSHRNGPASLIKGSHAMVCKGGKAT
jgi:hypothetical protein